jgi:hypothetical protein
MQVLFTRWAVDEKSRTPVSVDPSRVDVVEHYSDAFKAAYGEEFPAASKLVMKGKQEYIVQGAVAEVVKALNGPAKREFDPNEYNFDLSRP